MKSNFKLLISVICLSVLVFLSLAGQSQTYSNYTLLIKNEKLVSATTYQFDIYIKANTAGDQSNINKFQAAILINGAFFNSTTPSKNCQPATAVVSGTPYFSYVTNSSEFGLSGVNYW